MWVIYSLNFVYTECIYTPSPLISRVVDEDFNDRLVIFPLYIASYSAKRFSKDDFYPNLEKISTNICLDVSLFIRVTIFGLKYS